MISTFDKPKAAKRARPRKTKAREIRVIEDEPGHMTNADRYEQVKCAALERLKGMPEWQDLVADTRRTACLDMEQFVHHSLATFRADFGDGALRGTSSGIFFDDANDCRGYVCWRELVDELVGDPAHASNGHPPPHPALTGTTTRAGKSSQTSHVSGVSRETTETPETIAPNGSARRRDKKPQRHRGTEQTNGHASQTEAPARGTTGRRFKTPFGEACEVSVACIEPNPYQPRLDFPAAEIAELAQSIEAHGQLQRVLLREVSTGKFQLADGERRYRAVKHLGRDTILAEVREISDRQMAELALVANDDRKDLTAIERAQAYRRMLKEFGLTHEQLAAKLGRSKGFVSNLVRLLDLPVEPVDWQLRWSTGELSDTHAETLLPFVKHEKLSQALAKKFPPGDVPSAKDFPGELHGCVRRHSKETTGEAWCGGRLMRLSFTDAQLAELDCVAVKDWDGKVKKRALNVTLWNQLVGEKKKAKAAEERKSARARGDSVAARWKRDRAERDRQENLDRYRGRWIGRLIQSAMELGRHHKGVGQLVERMVFMLAMCADDFDGNSGSNAAARQALQLKSSAGHAEVWMALLRDGVDRAAIAFDFVCGQFGDDKDLADRYGVHYDTALFEHIAAALSIDLAAEWKADLMGALTEDWLELHTPEERAALSVELGWKKGENPTVAQMLAALRAQAPAKRKLPRELAGKKGSKKR